MFDQDLVEWVACLSAEWSPFDSSSDLEGCIRDFLDQGTMSVYLVAGFKVYDTVCGMGGPTGVATGGFPNGVGPDNRAGPVIPIRMPYWQDRLSVFLTGSDSEALCVVLNLATVLLHEMFHLCEADTNPDCNPDVTECCWQEQRMAASIFAWGMARRYTCLQGLADCHADNV